jgi:hypothetical protein
MRSVSGLFALPASAQQKLRKIFRNLGNRLLVAFLMACNGKP